MLKENEKFMPDSVCQMAFDLNFELGLKKK
jgi:hypothetical protein